MKNRADTAPIPIAVFGMSHQSREQLARLFQEHAHSEFIVAQEDQAQAGIIDLDGFGALETWRKVRQTHQNWPFIVFSVYARREEHAWFVQKPLEISALLQALSKLKKTFEPAIEPTISIPQKLPEQKQNATSQVQTPLIALTGIVRAERIYEDNTLCRQSIEINLQDSHTRAAIFYHPEDYLQGEVQKAWQVAKQHNSPVKIEGLQHTLFLSPQHDQAFYPLSESQLRTLAVMPIDETHVHHSLITPETLQQYLRNTVVPYYCDNFDSFLWKLALWGAHGRIPAGTNLDAPIALMHWPNLTRLTLIPGTLKITALWRRRPYSISETLNILNLKQCPVFAFYSAALAIGLALPGKHTPTSHSDNSPQPTAAKPHPAKGLLNSILGHLRKKLSS